jgi:hypothetical protein
VEHLIGVEHNNINSCELMENNIGNINPCSLSVSWVCHCITKIKTTRVLALSATESFIISIDELLIFCFFVNLFDMCSGFLSFALVYQEFDGIMFNDEHKTKQGNSIQCQWKVSINYFPKIA